MLNILIGLFFQCVISQVHFFLIEKRNPNMFFMSLVSDITSSFREEVM